MLVYDITKRVFVTVFDYYLHTYYTINLQKNQVLYCVCRCSLMIKKVRENIFYSKL